jgi:hypothetical protein
MFKRIFMVLICLFAIACTTDDEPVATRSAPLISEGIDFTTLFDELVAGQRSVPTKDPIPKDAEVITYSSLEQLWEIEAKTCDVSPDQPPTAVCAASIAAQHGWIDKPNSGCTTRQVCQLSGRVFVDPSARCRDCKTCCVTKDGKQSCTTTCGKEYDVRPRLQ